VLISTKMSLPMGDGPLDAGSSRHRLLASVEAALRRLGTDYIDLLQPAHGAGRGVLIQFSNSLSPLVIARSEATKQSRATRGALDCFAALAMTARHTSAFPRHENARVMHRISPSRRSEGAGNTGCWPHPRVLRAKKGALCARKQRQGSRNNRRSLRNGATAYT
jgi:Aldo/keto reductase family